MRFGFTYLRSSIILYLHIVLRTIIGFFFLVIPGIFVMLNYSQAFYILADDPTKMPLQCMAESKFIMRGNKGKLVLLYLSFIGWLILSGLPQYLLEQHYMSQSMALMPDIDITEIYELATETSYKFPVIVAGLLTLLANVYINAAVTGFYDIATGHLSVGGFDDSNIDYAGAKATAEDPFTGEEVHFKDADNE